MSPVQTADCLPVNEGAVKAAKNKMLSEDELSKMSGVFKIMSEKTRLKILSALFHNELCVNDIAVVLNMTKSAVSHQLKMLKDVRLVKSRKSGKNIYYSLDDMHVLEIFQTALVHIKHSQ